MRKSRLFALIGNILFSLLFLIAFGAFGIILLMKNSPELLQELQAEGLEMNLLVIAIIIAAGFFLVFLTLNWFAFARLDKEKGWRFYLLGIGIFYGLASMINGAGLILTLPLAICFVLAYVFKRQELLEEDEKKA